MWRKLISFTIIHKLQTLCYTVKILWALQSQSQLRFYFWYIWLAYVVSALKCTEQDHAVKLEGTQMSISNLVLNIWWQDLFHSEWNGPSHTCRYRRNNAGVDLTLYFCVKCLNNTWMDCQESIISTFHLSALWGQNGLNNSCTHTVKKSQSQQSQLCFAFRANWLKLVLTSYQLPLLNYCDL